MTQILSQHNEACLNNANERDFNYLFSDKEFLYHKLLEEYEKGPYPGCVSYSRFSCVLDVVQFKCTFGW